MAVFVEARRACFWSFAALQLFLKLDHAAAVWVNVSYVGTTKTTEQPSVGRVE